MPARSLSSLGFALSLLLGCGGTPAQAPQMGVAGSGGGGAGAEPPPEFTDEEMAIIRQLAPAVLPGPPPDISNRWADDANAARLGMAVFGDPELSGALIDADNDGGPNALGVVGQPGKVACAGCHMESAAFSDTRSAFREISLGTGWTHRRTPSLLDVAQAPLVTWGGRHSTLQSQIFAPIENPLEMNSSRLFVAHLIANKYRVEYEELFGVGALDALADEQRFPRLTPEQTGCSLKQPVPHPRVLPPDPLYECHGMPGDGAEYDSMTAEDQDVVTRIVINVGKAIAAAQRELTCGPGRFDDWVHGDAGALSAVEQRGLKTFIGKGKCVSCHSGPFLSDQRFYNLGLTERPTRENILNNNDRGAARDLVDAAADPLGVGSAYSDGDDGRVPTDIPPEYEGAFRTPTLRCVAQRPSFMHSGLIGTLSGVVAFLNRGGDPPGGYPGTKVLEPLGLTPAEESELVAFLRALNGR